MTNPLATSPALYRALTVSERCRILATQPPDRTNPLLRNKIGLRQLERWRNQRPFDSDEAFALRLGHLGADEATFIRALGIGPEELFSLRPVPPDWLTRLRQAYDFPAREYFEPPPGEEELGFLNLIEPLVELALDHLWQGIEGLPAHQSSIPFDPATVEDVMLMNLAEPLLTRLGRTLVLELNVLRLQGRLEGKDAQQRFLSFLRLLHDPAQAGEILAEYPVLARQLAICIDQWADVSLEFLHRLCADWADVKTTFSPGMDPGPLVQVTGGAGDTHRGGRSVMIAEFESGMQVVYKPKSLAIDVHFQSLLSRLNALGCDPPLRTFATLDRDEYGWAEYVERQECTDRDQIGRFYRRQGIYLALLYVLNAGDFHFENVIASGEYPILIDLETMLQPRFDRFEDGMADVVAERTMAESVLQIGLLPMRLWSVGDYDGIDISGLGGAGGQLSPDRIPEPADAGTDAMRYVRTRAEIAGDANRPILDGVEVNAVEYVEEIVSGFDHLYLLIANHKSELMQPGGLIEAFADDTIRVLLRPTRTYGQLLYESFHPDLLRSAVDRDLFFDRLWLVVPERSFMRDVVTSEQEDIQQGDIPVFNTRPDTLDLWDAQGRAIRGVLIESGMAAVRQRIAQLSEEDLQRQVWYIRASMATLGMDADGPETPRYPLAKTASRARRARLVDAVRTAADYLCATAVQGQADATWIGLVRQGGKRWTIAPVGIDLYGGTAGIALFLAYAGEALGETRYTDVARQAYTGVVQQIDYLSAEFTDVGGFEGWGGVLYAFTHLGALWSDEQVISEAVRIAGIVRDVADQDDAFDVSYGCAGAISSLLALYQHRPSAALLEAASTCGERLLTAARKRGRLGAQPARRYSAHRICARRGGHRAGAITTSRRHRRAGLSRYRHQCDGVRARSVLDRSRKLARSPT